MDLSKTSMLFSHYSLIAEQYTSQASGASSTYCVSGVYNQGIDFYWNIDYFSL